MKKVVKELRLENTNIFDLVDDLFTSIILFGGMYLLALIIL